MRLIAEKLGAERGGEMIFAGVSFALGDGEALVVSGSNGAGKTTLLRVIAGLLRANSGSVTLDGGTDEKVAAQCHLLGPQNAMKAALSVHENLAFWQAFSGVPHLGVEEALDKVGLSGLGETPFAYLSTGQKRRVAIARLLLSHRPVWLLDEPTSGLDDGAAAKFTQILQGHLGEGGIAVAATHLPLELAGARELRMEVAG